MSAGLLEGEEAPAVREAGDDGAAARQLGDRAGMIIDFKRTIELGRELVAPFLKAAQHVGSLGNGVLYVKDGVTHPEDRPVTFVFNGGPGAADHQNLPAAYPG